MFSPHQAVISTRTMPLSILFFFGYPDSNVESGVLFFYGYPGFRMESGLLISISESD